MRVLIRVDGSETIGMGHVMRCITLARELSSDPAMNVEFVTRAEKAALRSIEQAGFPVHSLPRVISRDQARPILREIMIQTAACAFLTDLRELEPADLAGAREAGLLTAVIDEWGNKEIQAELLFNGTAVPSWRRYVAGPSVSCYLGLAYALLEPAFARVHDEFREIPEKARRILIVLGGDDPFHLTVKIMESLERLPDPLEVTVLIGPAFLEEDEAQIYRHARRSRHRVTVMKNAQNVAQRMREADLSVIGGGLTALEAACAGTPALIVCEVNHQVETAAALEQEGAAVNLGLGVQASHEKISGKVAVLLSGRQERFALSRAGKRLVDGRGTERVARILREALAARTRAGQPEAVG